MNITNGAGWQQPVISRIRSTAETTTEQQPRLHIQVSNSSTPPRQQSRSNSAQQSNDGAHEEAMAKLKVQMQALKQSTSAEPEAEVSSAAQAFRDYMALSPAEKIRERLLNELGLTKEEFDALPPEEQEKIERKIADQMKNETEMETQATLSAILHRPPQAAKQDAQLT